MSPSASATRSAALAPLLSGIASMPSPQVSRKAAARSQAHPPTWTFTRNASAPFAANAANKSLRVRTTRGVLTARSAARNAAPALPFLGLDARDLAGGCVVGTCLRRGTKLAESGFLPSETATRRGARVATARSSCSTGRGRGGVPSIVFRRPFFMEVPRRRRLGELRAARARTPCARWLICASCCGYCPCPCKTYLLGRGLG